jgi:hypothetical protein
MAFLLTSMLDCIIGSQAATNTPLTTLQTASSITTKIMTADTPSNIEKQIHDDLDLDPTSWGELLTHKPTLKRYQTDAQMPAAGDAVRVFAEGVHKVALVKMNAGIELGTREA